MRLTQTRSVRLVRLMCACMKHEFSKSFELYISMYSEVFIDAILFRAILKYCTLIIQK
jgi:hypothetical protein